MPNVDYQRHSFLGGEVSPSLYERADMEKFGRWFSKAENIRFRETGAFRNRCGFVKVADTKYNSAGQIIKLLSFAFNDEESFLVELGPNYARFFRNGQPVMNGAVPYELQTTYTIFTEEDIKYAQAGDTIFITHPTQGIYELARLQSDGSAWEWRKFNTDILPMKEENEDKNDKISSAAYEQQQKYCSIENPYSSTYNNVSFTFNSSEIYTAETATLSDIEEGISEQLSDNYNVYLRNNKIYIVNKTVGGTVPDFSIAFSSRGLIDYSVEASDSAAASYASAAVSYADFYSLESLYVHAWGDGWINGFEGTKVLSADSVDNQASATIGYGSFSNTIFHTNSYSEGAVVNTTDKTITYTSWANNGTINSNIKLSGKKESTTNYSYSSQAETTSGYYTLTATESIFDRTSVGDCILVKHSMDTQQLKGSYNAAGTYTLGPIKSDGNWRFYTLGNWVGDITIQYSEDGGTTWVDYYKWTSQDANDTPANINTSGSLTTDNLVQFHVVAVVTSTGTKPLQISFTANSFTTNSYYKILSKNSATSVVAECVKNDIGTFSNKYEWRLPAFSNAEGWPQTVAFYQNRLFFGKDYIVYGSRSNDFWDFYEPTKLQADDPITMSLLSQKVNTIRNLITQRSFFTFTAGGEFGIGSEGTLTQSDKYLKPFSSNGSAPCLPVLISDKVLFVDKSYNSIRALQYSLESDGYEAPDITLTLRALLENEHIISSDIIYEEKEALFLSTTGTIWVLKYITDQNVLSWSHWKHAFGKITDICVVPHGAKHDLYIAVEANGKKWIEVLNPNEYMDTVEYFTGSGGDTVVQVTGVPGDKKVIIQGNVRVYRTIGDGNYLYIGSDNPDGKEIDRWQPYKVGSVYTSTSTLLSPVIQASEYSHSNYEVKKPYKVYFYYLNSHGFKVGVEEDEKMPIEWQSVDADIDDELELTSGKKSVLIPSRFDGSARVSFVQEEPFPMEVADVLIQTDYGGK